MKFIPFASFRINNRLRPNILQLTKLKFSSGIMEMALRTSLIEAIKRFYERNKIRQRRMG